MAKGIKIHWTPEMINQVKLEFPYRFNRELSHDLGISPRSLIRKARELGLDKEPGFLDKNRSIITEMAIKAHPGQPTKGLKGWSVPNSEATRFQPGNISPMTIDRTLVDKCHKSRNETIRKEKLRLKYGMRQRTNLKLTNIY
jgi:hypothetical protein